MRFVIVIMLLFATPVFATVSDGETIRESFTTNGSTTTFTFTFKCNSSDDVFVYSPVILTGLPLAPLIEDTDYTIAPTGGSYLNGGVVTIDPALASTVALRIVRRIKQSQETSSGAITPATIVSALDKLTRGWQDQEDRNNRSLRVPESDSVAFDMTIPNVIDRAGKVLNFDESGNVGVTTGADTFTVVNGVYETITVSGTITATDFITKGPWFDIRAYGAATGNSAAVNTVAIQATIDAAELVSGTVFVPTGVFQHNELTITSVIDVTGQGSRGSVLEYQGSDNAFTYGDRLDGPIGASVIVNFYKLHLKGIGTGTGIFATTRGSFFRDVIISQFTTGMDLDFSFTFKFNNVKFLTCTTGISTGLEFNACSFINCQWDFCDTGFYSKKVVGVNFTGCQFENYDDAILFDQIDSASTIRALRIGGCYFEAGGANDGRALKIDTTTPVIGLAFYNNWVKASTSELAIIIDTTTASSKGTIENNFFTDGAVSPSGICRLDGGANRIVFRNNWTDAGIDLLDAFTKTNGIRKYVEITQNQNPSRETYSGVVEGDMGFIVGSTDVNVNDKKEGLLKWDGTNELLLQYDAALVATDIQNILAGTSGNRPTTRPTGYRYFDTTIGKPVWWDGSAWVDATGAGA